MFGGFFSAGEGGRPADDAGEELCRLLDVCDPLYSHKICQGVEPQGWMVESGPFCCTSGSDVAAMPAARTCHVLAAWVRLDDRKELARTLSLDPGAGNFQDKDLILAAWLRWGRDCVHHLSGDFAFAVLDWQRRSLFLARDPMGAKPLYYRVQGNVCRFATTMVPFAQLPDWRSSPNQAWICRYLYDDLRTPPHESAFSDVAKLPPGHFLEFNVDGLRLERYFHFRDDSPSVFLREEHWVDAYREQLHRAVICRFEGQERVGAENSGGIDSAAVLGVLGTYMDDPRLGIHAFTYACDDEEASYALEVARHVGLTHNHFSSSNLMLEDDVVETGLQVIGHPPEHVMGWAASEFLKLCRYFGISRMFSGFGGDEAVSIYGELLLEELWDQGEWGLLWESLPRGLRRRMEWMRWRWGRRNEIRPVDNRHLQQLRETWAANVLRDEVVEAFDLEEALLSQVAVIRPRINENVLSHLGHHSVPARLESCTLMARRHGIEYVWPLLDPRLIQQYLSTPSIEKFGPGAVDRYLHRRAMVGFAPERVIWFPHKSFEIRESAKEMMFLRHLPRLQIQLREAAENLSPALKELIDPQKLERVIRGYEARQGDVTYRMEFVNLLNCLKWLNPWLHGLAAR